MSISDTMGLTPAQIVAELDRFIIGQKQAKKAVAIALRNRFRRRHLTSAMQREVSPKNILMIGSTGVGKTEIARRLAKLTDSPFIKIEATKFTEVGYVGRDVESIIRDLVESAISNCKLKAKIQSNEAINTRTLERLINALVGESATVETKKKFKAKILKGDLDNTEIEIDLLDNPKAPTNYEIPGMAGAAMGVINISDMIGKALGSSKMKAQKLLLCDAMKKVKIEEADKLIDEDKIIEAAIDAVENDGIVFLDEIDKIASRGDNKSAEVSREGVQRDLLPLIEGTNVSTKYGTVKTDHILFIASGAFHLAKPSDLLPELQGRLPIRVELKALTSKDMQRILVEPEMSLIKQYVALLATEGLNISFTDEAIIKIADYAANFNLEVEDIGARRLHTIIENLLEDISFAAPDLDEKSIKIEASFVEERLAKLIVNIDLAKFIL